VAEAMKRSDTQAKIAMWGVVFQVLLLILWGAVVRATGSGLGCPDWPLCSGQVIPPFETAAVLEFIHRLLALFLTVSVVRVLVWSWFGKGRMREVRKILTIATVLLVAHILLGAVPVLTELPAILVGSHMTIGMLFLSLMVIASVQVQNLSLSVHGMPKWRGIAALIGGLLVLVSGAFVVGMAAGIACQGFVTCDGGSTRLLEEIHMGHRYAAYVFSITVALLAGWRLRLDRGRSKWLGLLAIALLAVQITIGFTQVQMGLPDALRVGHVFTASLIMATVTALFFWPLTRDAGQQAVADAPTSAASEASAPDPA